MRACKLVPVAAANIPDELRGAVAAAGLGVWRPPVAPRGRSADESEAAESGAGAGARPAAAAAALPALLPRAPHTGPMVVTKPVRGGQVIHARDNDLVVLAPVNPGAQVIADGHLHVYAPLRGRAVAGAAGLPGARIFCQKLEAELVAIAGAYVMAEEIPAALRGRAAQVFLENGECRITACAIVNRSRKSCHKKFGTAAGTLRSMESGSSAEHEGGSRVECVQSRRRHFWQGWGR